MVLKAVNAYQLSVGCLAMDQVCSCFEFSKVSFKSSEEVFFDNSLLALLYFPEDQKYAIYVPLFLPILSVSLLSWYLWPKSLSSISFRVRQRKNSSNLKLIPRQKCTRAKYVECCSDIKQK